MVVRDEGPGHVHAHIDDVDEGVVRPDRAGRDRLRHHRRRRGIGNELRARVVVEPDAVVGVGYERGAVVRGAAVVVVRLDGDGRHLRERAGVVPQERPEGQDHEGVEEDDDGDEDACATTKGARRTDRARRASATKRGAKERRARGSHHERSTPATAGQIMEGGRPRARDRGRGPCRTIRDASRTFARDEVILLLVRVELDGDRDEPIDEARLLLRHGDAGRVAEGTVETQGGARATASARRESV